MFVYILVYGIRPLIIRPKPVGMADVINWALVLTFDGALLYTCGFKSLLYLLMGTVFGGGLHPIAGHLIQEHYMFVTVRYCHTFQIAAEIACCMYCKHHKRLIASCCNNSSCFIAVLQYKWVTVSAMHRPLFSRCCVLCVHDSLILHSVCTCNTAAWPTSYLTY